MIRLPESRQSPSTILLEREVDSTESILRDSLAIVTSVIGSSDDVHTRKFITSLKIKTKNYEVANHALVNSRRQTGHVHAAEQLIESRLDIVHRDAYQAVKLFSSRLVTLGHERCSSLQISNTSEDRFARDNNNLVKNQGDTMRDHSGSLAGADLIEKSVKVPETHRGQPKQLVVYNDSRSITKQIIDDFEPETVKPIMSRPIWRNNFTGVNVGVRPMKLPETYREAPKLDVVFEHNLTLSKQLT